MVSEKEQPDTTHCRTLYRTSWGAIPIRDERASGDAQQEQRANLPSGLRQLQPDSSKDSSTDNKQKAVTNDFLPKHVNDILRDWQKSGMLQIVDMNTGEIIEKSNMFKVKYEALKNPHLRFELFDYAHN